MLKQLNIQNFAIIEEANVDFTQQLNIITGETGAGKSLLLDALSMVLGNRIQGKLFFNPEKKCIVELEVYLQKKSFHSFFKEHDIDFDEHTILRREITPSGKSRAFINDSPVKLPVLKTLTESLIDIHSQHQTLKLSEGEFQLDLLDAYILTEKNGNHFQGILKSYRENFHRYQQLKQELIEQEDQLFQFNREKDYKTFLLGELDNLDLENLDEKAMDEELQILNNAESIQMVIGTLQNDLNADMGPLNQLKEWKNQLDGIKTLSEQYNSWYERINGLLIDLEDFRFDINATDPEFTIDPEHQNAIQERLYELDKLKQKHACSTLDELREYHEKLSAEVSDSLELENSISLLKSEIEQLHTALGLEAGELHKIRKKSCKALSDQLQNDLQYLGMPDTVIFYQFDEKKQFHAKGIDSVQIHFSSNKGFEAKPIGQVASGGELSRLTLAMKAVLAKQKAIKTLIFDEIDTGVSGEIAEKIGRKLEQIADYMQIICISHLPQTAAKGAHHLKVYKLQNSEKTQSKIKVLTAEERVVEIAEILSGKNKSETAIAHAKELLAQKA